MTLTMDALAVWRIDRNMPDLYMAKLTVRDLPVESLQRILAVMGSDEIIKRVKSELRARRKSQR